MFMSNINYSYFSQPLVNHTIHRIFVILGNSANKLTCSVEINEYLKNEPIM